MLRRVPVLLPVLALGAATAVMLPAATGSAAPVATTGKTYVALGDSYAAGFGLPLGAPLPDGSVVAPTRTDFPGCAQTSGDYPHLLAAQLGLTLTDVTCSGAVTEDFSAPQDVPAGPQPPAQTDVFKTLQPDLVTITIGGNDLGFSKIAQDCLALTATGPLIFHQPTNGGVFDNCKQYYTDAAIKGNGVADNPYDLLDKVEKKVDAAIAEVHSLAPNAAIAVIAYPAIAPDTANTPAGGCFAANALPAGSPFPSTLPFTDVDVPFLQVLQQDLDQRIGKVAASNGAAYADVYPSSLSHSACQPETTRWVEPVVPGGGGTNVLHPSVAGTTAMAAALVPVVTALLAPPATTSPAPSNSPTGTGGTTTSGPTLAGGGAPLADTGVDVPVPWLLGLAGVLLAAGGAAMAAVRRRPATHA